MIKKFSLLLLLMVLTGLLGGCWDRREISEVAVVLGAGVDRTADGQISLTVQIARIGAFEGGGVGGGGAEPASWVVSAEGKTIEDAEKKLSLEVPRDIYWGHCVILVIGKEMAQKGTGKVIDFFLRDNEPRDNMWFMVAKGEAKDIMETYSDLTKTSAQAVGFLTRIGPGYSVNLREYNEMLLGKGAEPVATRVEVKKVGITPGPGHGKNSADNERVEITGTAVFKKDKLVGWLDDDETMSLLWLKGDIKRGIITVPGPAEPDNEVSIAIERGSAKVTPEYDGQNLRFNVMIEVEGKLLELQSPGELSKPEGVKALEGKAAAEIKRRAAGTLKKAQREYKVDIFGFGSAFHRKYKKDWQKLKDRWDEQFVQAEVNITATVNLRTIGLFSKQVSTPEKEKK